MATALNVVLPGDVIPAHALPTGTGKKKTLTLGPGLRHIPPNTVTTTVAGTLVTDNRKNAALVEFNSGRYTPYTGDLVIATVNGSAAENFNCLLTPETPPAALPHLAFEGATKKTRPQLPPNSLVYCRVASAGKDQPPELTCVDPSTGKSEGLGPLKGGMLFKISLGMARRLLAPKSELPLLDVIGAKVGFEITVGRNGLVHVDGGNVRTTLAVGRGIQEVDQKALGESGQRKLAADLLKGL
ncbi:exosome non-catalytic core subunit rrp40 [Curvularia kusanoi]|uniref:Exosome non-catalytic core subunit rrp40 n=1 Tax=Curvularia kusanoi TaxID=90978 RepID=A0A9P4TH22_CURKU|nr:exosome non-catalytic core subunit rrp40 [Curvularia kusanoi]